MKLGFHVRALLQLTNYLMMAGRYPEAEQLLRENLAKMPLKGGLSLQDLEWEIVALEIAKARRAQGDVPGAISEVALIEATLRDSPYAVNATIERAALLVKSGNYAEGLAALDDAAAKLNLLRDPKSKTSVVPSANRGLAWIRACALKGVGRSSEAAQALKPLFETAETDTAKFSDKHPDRLQTEAEVCMSDVSALKKQIADGLRSEVILTDALLFQPAYRPKQDKAIWGAVRSDPELQQLAAERTRVLPPEMTEALNWNEGER